MRRLLVRSTFTAVLLSVAIMGLSWGGVIWWASADDFRRSRTWLDAQSRPPLEPVLWWGVVAGLAVIAVLAGVWVASLQAGRFARPMTQLVDRAQRLGSGESSFQPLVTGILEVDRVSEALVRSAHQMTRSLAAERDFASDASHQL
ncbi:MAG TPA: sensor histidine kinase, partial [Dermatophilaceae bacterium]